MKQSYIIGALSAVVFTLFTLPRHAARTGALFCVRNPYQRSVAALAAGVVATGLLLGTSAAQAVQIDDFNGGDVDPPLLPFESSTDLYAGAVGGVRNIAFDVQGSSDGTRLSVLNGVYTHDSGSSGTASVITWDGVQSLGLFVDFTDGGASDRMRLALEIASLGPSDTSPTLEVFIRTVDADTGTLSEGTFAFMAPTSGLYDVPLDPFAYDISQTQPLLNFENVFSLQLTVRPRDADFVKIDNIATSPVPPAGNQPPVADANGPYTGEAGVAVSFDGSASDDPDGSIQTYAWDFGDGNTGSGATQTHTYATADVYNVTLTVTDNEGASDSDSTQANIGQGNQTPVADADGPYTGQAGVAVTFDGSASDDPDGSITTYAWDFGDGNTGSGVTPTHTYATADLYNVTLTVTDNESASDADSTHALIDVSQQPPVADANGPYQGTAGVAVSFDGSASADPDGTIQTYAWDFGDGNMGSGVTPTHTYAETGNYPVSLTVTDNDALSDSNDTTATIGVGNLPPVADAGGPRNGIVGIPITFSGSIGIDPDGRIVEFKWVYGDGIDSGPLVLAASKVAAGTAATYSAAATSGEDPSHAYDEPGLYYAILTVIDDDGAVDSASAVVTVEATDSGGGGGSSSDFLGCSIGTNEAKDPTLPLLVLLSVIYVIRRRHRCKSVARLLR